MSLDFVEGLPTSNGYNCILVVVDMFSKFSHFIALKHPFTALTVAKLFMTNIYKLHGLLMALVSDRDKIFTSTLWRELFRLAGVSLRLSSAYHPQSDSQTERVNQCMETFLDALPILCQPSGLSGSTSPNSGIILPATLLLISHHSLCSMVNHRGSWVSLCFIIG